MTKQVTYSKDVLSFADNYIDSLFKQESAIQGIAEAMLDKLTGKKWTDDQWQAGFKPFEQRAQLRAGGEEDGALVGSVTTMKSRVKGLLKTDYGVVIEKAAYVETKQARERREQREKEAEKLAPIGEKVVRHAEANGITISLAGEELAGKKQTKVEQTQIRKAARQAERRIDAERKERATELKKQLTDYLKDVKVADATDNQMEVMAAMVTALENTQVTVDDSEDIPA